MSRTDELKNIFKDVDEGKRVVVDRLIDEAVYLEERLAELKQYPQIKSKEINGVVHTKATAAAKQYRELLQTYTNIIRALERTYANEEQVEDSPLQQYFKMKLKEAQK